jgi:hypothetical protein
VTVTDQCVSKLYGELVPALEPITAIGATVLKKDECKLLVRRFWTSLENIQHLYAFCLSLNALVVKYSKSQNSGNKFVVIFTGTVALVGYTAAMLLSVPILASIGNVY